MGTTNIKACVFDQASGKILTRMSEQNAQTAYGRDVITRIGLALRGKAEALKEAAEAQVLSFIGEEEGAAIAGNTAMLSLLTGTDVSPLSAFPFYAEELFGREFLIGGKSCYLLPAVSAFVGADVSAGLLYCGCRAGDLLLDLGTNGEMVLLYEGGALGAAAAAGPAFFEGSKWGMEAAEGAIYDAAGIKVMGGGEPKGICASGLVSLLALLLKEGALGPSGRLAAEEAVVAGEIRVTQEEVRRLQLAKAAICAGVRTLMEKAGTVPGRVFITGNFGGALHDEIFDIGLLPSALQGKLIFVEDAALLGAAMACKGENREALGRIAAGVTPLDFGCEQVFSREFIDCMEFHRF